MGGGWASQHPDEVKRLLAFAEKCREELGDSLTNRAKGKGTREPGRVAGAEDAPKKKKKNAE